MDEEIDARESMMSGKELDIADMQCWVFRMAQSKGKMSSSIHAKKDC